MNFIGTVPLLVAGSACGLAHAECADFVVRMHITEPDHFSSKGVRIAEAGGILQQNMHHVNSGLRIDAYESADPDFQSRNARSGLAEAARSYLSQAQKARIEDIAEDNVITIGVNGCVDFEAGKADYRITHLTFSEIAEQGYSAPFIAATDDGSMWAPQNPELLSDHFHAPVKAEDFRIAYLANPEARLMMLNSEFFCGTLGCSAVLLDARDKLVWEGEMVEGRASVVVAANGNIINIYNARNELSQISMPN